MTYTQTSLTSYCYEQNRLSVGSVICFVLLADWSCEKLNYNHFPLHHLLLTPALGASQRNGERGCGHFIRVGHMLLIDLLLPLAGSLPWDVTLPELIQEGLSQTAVLQELLHYGSVLWAVTLQGLFQHRSVKYRVYHQIHRLLFLFFCVRDLPSYPFPPSV